jgi:carbonic anhydrase/acetyltransferase-like protein (isoleucine patch superfamily)
MALYQYENKKPEIDSEVYIAPTAVIIGDVTIDNNASVWFNCVVRGDVNAIQIGEESNIQDLTMLHADHEQVLSIGKRVTIGHGCVVHGCKIEDDSLVGMGAVIMTGAVIGKGSIIAAGAVVTENTIIPPFSLVTGVPGTVKRTLKEDIVQWNRKPSQIYANRSKIYNNNETFREIVG